MRFSRAVPTSSGKRRISRGSGTTHRLSPTTLSWYERTAPLVLTIEMLPVVRVPGSIGPSGPRTANCASIHPPHRSSGDPKRDRHVLHRARGGTGPLDGPVD